MRRSGPCWRRLTRTMEQRVSRGTRGRVTRCPCEGGRELRPSFPQSLTRQGWNVMGFFSQDIKNMDDLFVHTLRDIYYAEKQIVQALPEMIEKSTDAQLRQGFQSHLRETENHVKRLEKVFQ